MTEITVVETRVRVARFEDLVARFRDHLEANGVDLSSPTAVGRACYDADPDIFEITDVEYEIEP